VEWYAFALLGLGDKQNPTRMLTRRQSQHASPTVLSACSAWAAAKVMRSAGWAATRHGLIRCTDGHNDMLILSSLSNLRGLLLLHPPSRILFGREVYMNLLLDLLDPYNCPAIQSEALLVLVTALLATPQNTRTFEHMDGLLTVTSLFKDEETTQNVKVKLLEFVYFYLMPEAPGPATRKLVGAAQSTPRTGPSKENTSGRRKTRCTCSGGTSATSRRWSRTCERARPLPVWRVKIRR
jgi:hypothetical protein